MPDPDIRHRLESATRPAFARPVDVASDIARGRRSIRRRRAVQASAAGASACAIAGAVAVVGVPFAGGGAANSSDGRPVGVATGSDTTEPTEYHLNLGRVELAVREHLGLDHIRGNARVGENEPSAYVGWAPMHDDGESEARLLLRDGVRDNGEPVPLRCANDPAYDTCERETLPDGSEMVVGRGADDLLVARWGAGGDLVQTTAHWADGAEHDVTLNQLIGLASDERLYLDGRFDVLAR
jgi:hypothetical protein